jgi:hypothetical protein
MMYPHVVTVYPSEETTDTDGTPIRRPRATGTNQPAYVQPATLGGVAEDPAAAQSATADFTVWLDIGCPPLDAFAALVWNGDRYELDGEAIRFTSPDATLDHWRARIRRR